MFLSDYKYFTNESLKKALVTELFVRQIYWIEKNTLKGIEGWSSTTEMLSKAFFGSKTSNHLFVFNIEIAKFLIEGSEEKAKILDQRLGFLPENIIKSFQDRVVQIKAIGNYNQLMGAIGYMSYIKSPQQMAQFLFDCKKLASQQGYIR